MRSRSGNLGCMPVIEDSFSEFLRGPKTVNSPAALRDALLDAFPWTSFRPKADQAAFIDDFTQTIVAAAELDSFAALTQLVDEWRATAGIHADPELARRLLRSISVGGDVAAPC